MQNKILYDMIPLLTDHWDFDVSQSVIMLAEHRLAQLCRENYSICKAAKVHTEKNIFPCISLYEALQQNGISAKEALLFLDNAWSLRAEKGARQLRHILRIPGLYNLYPRMFQSVAKKQFGEAAGFSAHFYKYGRDRCKFDMKKCLFLDTCTKYGCPELTRCFCHVDDVNNRNLHPRLCWNRTQFMGAGAKYCDFDIFIVPRSQGSDC